MIPTKASKPKSRRLRLAKAGLLPLAAAGAAGLSLLVSGCGSSGTPVAQVASTPATTSDSPSSDDSKSFDPAAFSACMRKHGVPNFPDPDSKGGLTLNGNSGIDPRSPQFRAAQQACRKLLPNGGKPNAKDQAKALEQALKFSQCMRSHGVPNFPDPKASGGGMELAIPKSAGIDPNSPQFKAAQKACQKLLPGQGRGLESRGGGAAP
jgi:hypothetical protein